MTVEIDWKDAKYQLNGARIFARARRGNPSEEVELEYLRPEIRPVFEAKGGPQEGEILGVTVRLSRDQELRVAMVDSGEIERLREATLQYKEEGRIWYYVFTPTKITVGIWQVRER